MTFDDYQALLSQYVQAHPISRDIGFDYGQSPEYAGSSAQAGNQQREQGEQYDGWLSTLSPEQRAQYQQLSDADFSAGRKKMRLAFGAALAGIGGMGALAAGGLGGAGAAGAAGTVGGGGGLGPLALGGELGGVGGGMGAAAGGAAAGGGSGWLASLGLGGGGSGLLSGGNLLSVGGNLLSGAMGAKAAGDAVGAQVAAGQDSNALAERIYNQDRADRMPYMQAGTSALEGIQRLLSNPNSVRDMPDYQFGMNEGTKALNSGAAARGMTYSGAQGKALQRYGNDYAGTKLGESYNRLASIAGIGQQANAVGTAAGQNYANNAGQTMQGIGNARASGYVGAGNAWNNAIGGALNNYQQNNMLDMLMRKGG